MVRDELHAVQEPPAGVDLAAEAQLALQVGRAASPASTLIPKGREGHILGSFVGLAGEIWFSQCITVYVRTLYALFCYIEESFGYGSAHLKASFSSVL